MASSNSATRKRAESDPGPPTPIKVVIAGGFGVGKTTMVASISDIPPLSTEGHMTTMATGLDNRGEVGSKTTTTVALDFGRANLDGNLVLYLFGTPGQDRFGFMWDNLVRGAMGAIVLVDTRRIDDCYPAVDYFENRQVPFIVGINHFDGQQLPPIDDVRWALDLSADVPLVVVDARDRMSSLDALLVLLLRNMERAEAASGQDRSSGELSRSRLVRPSPPSTGWRGGRPS